MLVVDEEKVNKILKNKNINKSLEYLEMKVGTPLIKDNQLFYVIGGNKNNQLELKSMIATLKEIKTMNIIKKLNELTSREDRWLFPLSTLQKHNFKLCKVDVLGNIYDIKSFEEFF